MSPRILSCSKNDLRPWAAGVMGWVCAARNRMAKMSVSSIRGMC